MANNQTPRPVGRPRADGKPPLERREVLLTAGKLITEHGYAGTSLRLIAEALGTSAPAILQRFGNKAELLNELVRLMADVSVHFHSSLEALNLSPDVRLYKMVHSEVMALASSVDAPISVFYLPELRQPEFKVAQQARARMMNFYLEVVTDGINAELFHDGSATTIAEQIFQLTETVMIAQDRQSLGAPEVLAEHTATFALRGIMRKPNRLARIQTAAKKIDMAMV